ncbi:hypothetical protein K523DRAFT_327571 [Schizophyllum commune Tattone D]|nr:hypothetical protein K523DRAFT_327571 [Schizophyllum commune Tattone D]
MTYSPWHRCPLSGETENLARIQLIPDSVVDEAEIKVMEVSQVARMEWFWGLKRGGLLYYLAEPHNYIYLRHDIAELYARFEFLLAPTFKWHSDIILFRKHAGVMDRSARDVSHRRPLTALSPTGRLYRYAFVPFTDAARKLQEELKLKPQTEADLAYGIHPVSRAPWLEGCEAFPVVECYAHPYSVSTLAEQIYAYHKLGTRITAEYSLTTLDIVRQWSQDGIQPPEWFVEAPGMDEDDQTLAGSQADGYDISIATQSDATPTPDTTRKRKNRDGDEDTDSVFKWARGVDPKSRPLEQPPRPPSPIPVRRSERLLKRAYPDGNPPPVFRPESPVRKAPWPTAFGQDPVGHPPAWTRRNGRFPTRRFSSNDWAYFCRGVALAAPRKS